MILPLWREYTNMPWERREEIWTAWCDHKGYKHNEDKYGEEFVAAIPDNQEQLNGKPV